MTVQEIRSLAQFKELANSDKTIYVDFYADWCGPCKAISPHFAQLAGQHASQGAVEFYKVNIDDVGDLAEELGIRSIPTFHAYRRGQRLDQLIGANQGALTTLVTKHKA